MNRNADTAYRARHDQCRAHLRGLELQLEEHRADQVEAPRDWRLVGDLAEVEELLRRASELLAGQVSA
jgi:hypothetical protein